MVRWVAISVIAVLGACSGRSTRDDNPETGGTDAGGSGVLTGGSSTGGSSTGGALTGGSSTGGSSAGGSSAGGSNGGAFSGSGGASTGGAAGTGVAGMGPAGAAGSVTGGEGGASGDCTEPNPAGCQTQGCPSGQSCVLTSGSCVPSSCSCVGGQWACTRDCGGGVCVEGEACSSPKPPGCNRDSQCASGERCIRLVEDICLHGGDCVCDPFNDEWICDGACTLGACGIPECPAGCEASREAFCENDGVTWVCGATGPFDATELIGAGCTDLATQIPRYCCPQTFRPECLPESLDAG